MTVCGTLPQVLETFVFFLIDRNGARRHVLALCEDLPDALRRATELLAAHEDLHCVEIEVGANTFVVERPRPG